MFRESRAFHCCCLIGSGLIHIGNGTLALLRTLTIPTLVVCGHEDSWSPIERHEDMASRIPRSVLVDVPQCGHMCTLEQPEIVSAALQAWLEDRPQLFSRELHPR